MAYYKAFISFDCDNTKCNPKMMYGEGITPSMQTNATTMHHYFILYVYVMVMSLHAGSIAIYTYNHCCIYYREYQHTAERHNLKRNWWFVVYGYIVVSIHFQSVIYNIGIVYQHGKSVTAF